MAIEPPPAERSLLLELPAELLIHVFSSAPSLRAASSLAATSKQLQQVWKEHLTTICHQVASATIPCYRDLRLLLADQGHLAVDAQTLTLEDVKRIILTSDNGRDLVTAYHKRMESQPYCDPQVPLVLSRAERHRYIRAQYQLWGLLRLSARERKVRVESLDLKTLSLLSDFLCNFYHYKIRDPVLTDLLEENLGLCGRLQQSLRHQRNVMFLRLHKTRYSPIDYVPYETGGRWAWWCDREQDIFKQMVTGSLFRRPGEHGGEESGGGEEVVWDDSGEDEEEDV